MIGFERDRHNVTIVKILKVKDLCTQQDHLFCERVLEKVIQLRFCFLQNTKQCISSWVTLSFQL